MKSKKELIREWNKIKPKETPVVLTEFNSQKIIIKDESKNLTNTYKAKHGWMLGKHYLENIYPRPFIYYLGSTGNAGISDFLFVDKLNKMIGEEKVIVANFYPEHYDSKLLGPDSFGRFTNGRKFRESMENYKGSRLIRVDFNEKYWFGKPCLDKMNELGINANKNNSLDITEGFNPTYNQVMQEFISQIKNKFQKIPKTLVIIQYGAGMLYDDCKEVSKNLPIDFIAVSTGDLKSIADKICDNSETWQESLKDLREKGYTKANNSGDKIYHVNEQEILYALSKFKELNIEAEPSGAAGFALILRLKEIIKKKYDLIAVINTGNGIKEIGI
ncbi:hypothetical protein KAI04_00935 [Candidatus Pacearchaeota archaeon]|nr:hypothetical protein [Candidatus Pacearchaeota archaeon]